MRYIHIDKFFPVRLGFSLADRTDVREGRENGLVFFMINYQMLGLEDYVAEKSLWID